MLTASVTAAFVASTVLASNFDWSVRLRIPVLSRGFIDRSTDTLGDDEPFDISPRDEFDLTSLTIGRRFAGRWLGELGAGYTLTPGLRFQSTLLAGRAFPLLGDPVARPSRAGLELQMLGGLLYRGRADDWIHNNGVVGQRTLAASAQVGLDAIWPVGTSWGLNLRASVAGSRALLNDGPATWYDKEGAYNLENYRYGVNGRVDIGVTF